MTINSPGKNITVSLPVGDRDRTTKQFLATPREPVQERKDLPAPRGRVNGNAANSESLTEYTDQETVELEAQWSKDIREHDLRVVEEVAQAIRAAEDRRDALPAAHIEIPQIEPPATRPAEEEPPNSVEARDGGGTVPPKT